MQEDWAIWRDQSKWPFAPSEYVFLATAGLSILEGLSETGVALSGADAPYAWKFLHQTFADGNMVAVIRDDAFGKMHDLRPEAWNCERAVAEKRIRTCQFDAADPFSVPGGRRATQSRPCWLFVHRHNLEENLKALKLLSKRQVGEMQDSALQVQSTVAAVSDCAAWLEGEFGNRSTEGRDKDQFKTIALSKFTGRLSGRGFDTAWRRARATFPGRAKPGPKRTKS